MQVPLPTPQKIIIKHTMFTTSDRPSNLEDLQRTRLLPLFLLFPPIPPLSLSRFIVIVLPHSNNNNNHVLLSRTIRETRILIPPTTFSHNSPSIPLPHFHLILFLFSFIFFVFLMSNHFNAVLTITLSFTYYESRVPNAVLLLSLLFNFI